jgi:hypothetical protein
MNQDEFDRLPLDDRFMILLHKKIMNKTGSAKRRCKKYYMDQYRKSGVIPKPLWLAAKGIMEGRKCSGRPPALSEAIKSSFRQMVKASSDPLDDRFIFITQNCRTIKNYHFWLQEEFKRKISLPALRRYARKEKLKAYLNKPDFDEPPDLGTCFKDEPVFALVQVDGCTLRYLKIRTENNTWQKPQVIEFYDTGSRKMFVLDAYFSESSENSIDIFSQFLLSSAFPNKKIRLRPDNAKGFLNLKRPINELNIKYSMPDGFYLQPDFSRINAPKDKVHLESSHRSLHNFEMRIIKFFQHRIAKTQPGYIFKKGKKEKIMVTYLDIDLEQLRNSGLLQSYRRDHNEQKHYFSVDGKISAWVPAQKFDAALCQSQLLSFDPDDVKDFIKYGFDKIKATVSKKGTLTFNNRTYYVAVGMENFSRHKSSKVHISDLGDKLLIFEYKKDGILLGEALCRQPFAKPPKQQPTLEANPVELILAYLESQKMVVDRLALIKVHHQGLTLEVAKTIYAQNQGRYNAYSTKLRQPEKITGKALFNAFILDCQRHLSKHPLVHYASSHQR